MANNSVFWETVLTDVLKEIIYKEIFAYSIGYYKIEIQWHLKPKTLINLEKEMEYDPLNFTEISVMILHIQNYSCTQ